MNDPSVHDVLAGSLDRHGRAVGTPEGDLADVLRRVDRRRTRRRSTAVIGSSLAVAAGAAGIMLVAAPADAPAPGDGDPDATAAASWGCAGFLSFDGTADYYAACEAFPFVVTPTMPVLPPATSVVAITVAPSTTAPFAITVSPITTTTTTTTTIPTEGIEPSLSIGGVASVPDPIATLPPPTTAVSSAVSSPPVCESGPADARVTVPCEPPPLPTTTTTTTTTAPALAAPGTAFRCTGPLGGDLAYSYYRSCETVPVDAVPPMPSVPTTMTIAPLVFGTTVPPTLPPTAPVATSPTEQMYTVVQGDSLSSIADLYGISLQILVNYNEWPEGLDHMLFPGDIVKIPPDSRIP